MNPPVDPMLAKAVHSLPPAADGELMFEPKWDGFRCIVFRDGDEVELGSRNQRPFNRYFPELPGPLREHLPERVVIDGELIVPGPSGLDFDALGQRIHPAAKRVNMLAEQTPASFVAFDLLAMGTESLMTKPFIERRRQLEDVANGFGGPLLLTPSTTDRAEAQDWFDRFEGAGFDGVMAKPADGPYLEGKRAQFKVKQQKTADCVVAGYRIHKSGDGVGSLLLGAYDDDQVLHHLGVASSFKAAERPQLLTELARLHLDDISSHPWGGWAEQTEASDGTMPGGPQPVERQQGHELGSHRPGLGGRGPLRTLNRWQVQGSGSIEPLAARPRAAVLPCLTARSRRPRRDQSHLRLALQRT